MIGIIFMAYGQFIIIMFVLYRFYLQLILPIIIAWDQYACH